MGKKLQYGMVGGGQGAFIGAVHRSAINLIGRAELTAGCFSRSYENSLLTGEELGIDKDRIYKTYSKMAKSEAEREDPIDFVVITTPNNNHFEASRAFLEAGINVVCEKPLVSLEDQADELEKIAGEKGLLFAVTYTYSGNVMAKQARELIRSGAIGNIRMVMGEYPQGWLSSVNGGKGGIWRCDPMLSGGSNALGDIGTHIEHTVSFMTGLKIKRVLAKMDVMAEGRTLDDNSVVLLEYEGGASGTYWVSQIALGCDNDLKIRIFGSKGSIEWCQDYSEELYLTGEDGVRRLYRRGYGGILPKAAKYSRLPAMHNEGYLEALGNIYLSFCDCVMSRKNGCFKEEDIDFPTIEDGKNGVKFINRCIESSKKGNIWVDF